MKEISPASGRREIFDAYCPGLCIRITHTRHKSFCRYDRLGGKTQQLTPGPYPSVKIKAARKLAEDTRTAVSEGRNPALETRERQDAHQTLRDLARDHPSSHAEQKKSAESLRNDRAMLGIDEKTGMSRRRRPRCSKRGALGTDRTPTTLSVA